MNTTQNTSSQAATSRFGSLRNLGRGIVVSSAVALMGVSTMSAADASAAGVATGIRYARAGRYERPQPVAAASAPVLATEPAPACPQPPMPFLDDVVGSNIGALVGGAAGGVLRHVEAFRNPGVGVAGPLAVQPTDFC